MFLRIQEKSFKDLRRVFWHCRTDDDFVNTILFQDFEVNHAYLDRKAHPGHPLCGPSAIQGAEPCLILEVKIRDIQLFYIHFKTTPKIMTAKRFIPNIVPTVITFLPSPLPNWLPTAPPTMAPAMDGV